MKKDKKNEEDKPANPNAHKLGYVEPDPEATAKGGGFGGPPEHKAGVPATKKDEPPVKDEENE